MEQPPHNTTRAIPRCFVEETGPRIGEPVIGEPHLALGGDIELARLSYRLGHSNRTRRTTSCRMRCFRLAEMQIPKVDGSLGGHFLGPLGRTKFP
uniref:Uncharacterized protein n=1 Tax=Cannabis sativa TaxID=3483 RepID=A0A803NI38_CANSA